MPPVRVKHKSDIPLFYSMLPVGYQPVSRFLSTASVGVSSSGNRETVDQLKVLAARANRAELACQKAGIQLCHHHHSFEFKPLTAGTTGGDVFAEEFDPKLVNVKAKPTLSEAALITFMAFLCFHTTSPFLSGVVSHKERFECRTIWF
jgi:hypothetical protein